MGLPSVNNPDGGVPTRLEELPGPKTSDQLKGLLPNTPQNRRHFPQNLGIICGDGGVVIVGG